MGKAWRVRVGLRSKVALATGAVALASGAVYVIGSTNVLRTHMEPELHERGATLARLFGHGVVSGVVGPDGLGRAAEAALSSLRDAAYVVIRDDEGQPLAVARARGFPDLPVPEAGPGTEDGRDLVVGGVSVHEVVLPLPEPLAPPRPAADGTEVRVVPMGGSRVVPVGSAAPAAGGVVVPADGGRTVPADAAGVVPAAGGDGSSAAPPPPRRRPAVVQLALRRDTLERDLREHVVRSTGVAVFFTLLTAGLGIAMAWGATRRLRRLRSAADALARGAPHDPLPVHGHDEVTGLARSFALMAESWREAGRALRRTAEEVARESNTMVETAKRQAATAREQAQAIQETTRSVEQLSLTSREATRLSDEVLERAGRFQGIANEGEAVVDETLEELEHLGQHVQAIATSIAALEERTRQIQDVIETAEEVAEESNLLALNAAIEAARAGEQGRSFGVVAREMKGLADQSKAAAARVRVLLSDIREGTAAAVAATDEGRRRAADATASARAALSRIRSMSEEIREGAEAARKIAQGHGGQRAGIEMIAGAVADLSRAMTESLAGAKQIEEVARNLDEVATRLAKMFDRHRA